MLTAPSAEEIRAFRTARGWAKPALADALGVSLRAVEEWEAGRSKPFAYLRLALERLDDLAGSVKSPEPEFAGMKIVEVPTMPPGAIMIVPPEPPKPPSRVRTVVAETPAEVARRMERLHGKASGYSGLTPGKACPKPGRK